MWYLVQQLWLFLLIALLFGVFIGWHEWAKCDREGGKCRGGGWSFLLFAIVVAVIGAYVTANTLFPGRLGFWIETGLLLAAAYILGCFLGCLIRCISGSKSAGSNAGDRAAASIGTGIGATAASGTASLAGKAAERAASGVDTVRTGVDAAADTAASAVETATGALDDAKSGITGAMSGTEDTAASAASSAVALTGEPGVTGAAGAAAEDASAMVGPDDDPNVVAARPEGLAAPKDGKKDDLKRIRGIGRVNEAKLNELGIFHFFQIADWKPEQAKWVNTFLAFPGRIQREDWIGQAKFLAQGLETAFSKRVDSGDVPTSK